MMPSPTFSADIICRSLPDEHRVVIENQLERTDHDHLGKLLTYAGGLDDVHTTILLAPEIRDEHRAAIDWLNAVTIEGVHFFGVELQVWRIGDSLPAPRFVVVARPNDWRGTAVAATSQPLTPTKQLQLNYWAAFRDHLQATASTFVPQTPRPQNWTNFSLGRSGAHLVAIASTYDAEHRTWRGQNRVELYLHGDDAVEVLGRLLADREAIEEALGPLTWSQLEEDTKARRVYASQPADLEDRDAWAEQFAWLEERLQSFDATFRDRVKRR